MSIEQVAAVVGSTPFMKRRQAELITDLVREHDLTDILELGFFHGVSTCYLADVVRELGRGHVTAIDRADSADLTPSAESLLDQLDLGAWVTLERAATSYNWTLMQMLERDATPRFDLCYLDGAHDWFTDGFAFFLVDRLLRPGGWIVFDDLTWAYGTSPSMAATELVRAMPAEERDTQQVMKVWELLVQTQPGYDQFRRVDDWGIAHKAATDDVSGPTRIVREVVVQRERYGAGALVREAAVKARKKLQR